MCDYSLGHFSNRLAREGEALVAFRFNSGSMGLADPADVQRAGEYNLDPPSWLRRLLGARRPEMCAVCVPPGARLRIFGFPLHVQSKYGIGGGAIVRFTQVDMDAPNQYHDAIRFANGGTMLLQELHEGQPVRVLELGSDLGSSEERETLEAEMDRVRGEIAQLSRQRGVRQAQAR